MSKHITATTAADILAFFPHSLGFDPRESFGFITLNGTRTGASLRMDIPDESVSPSDFAQMIAHHLLSDTNADGTLFLVYTNEPAADPFDFDAKPYKDYAQAIEIELESAGIPIRDGWLITDHGWTTYFCEDADCCTMNPLSDIEDSVLSAHMVFAGSAKCTELAENPAFIGREDTGRRIHEAAARLEVRNPVDFTEPAMCEARSAWYEAVGTQPDEEATIQLVSYLQVKALRDRIMADMINPAEDEGIYRAVFMGQHPERPDWSRVDACEVLLVQLLACTPTADRAPLFSALGWLAWYKGQGSLAADYLAKAMESEPGYRLAELLDEMLRTGLLAKTSTNPNTAYKRGTHS
ncbi:DUF4192 domain-containing protein [Arthrobacter sp. NPDC097144]|uniref:DUF4192 domain-containing protein n=1 Tax=Arthrobacter sp. NPDC097144 TaxID=3363946 RepID=UPI00382036CE